MALVLARALLLIALGGSLSGCVPLVGNQLVQGPSQTPRLRPARWLQSHPEYTDEWWVESADGEARLRARTFGPPEGAPELGITVVALHGIYSDSGELIPVAQRMAAEGFDIVLLDLRAHGESTGTFTTYGAKESQDVSGLLDWLDSVGLPSDRLALLGHSMGAATALLTAARDERVGAVVAVAPYSSMRAVVRSAMASRAGWADRWVSLDDLTERLVAHASGRADFDPAMASPIESAPALDVPVLYLHGEDDCVVPEVQSRALAEVTAESFRQTFPGSSHVDPVRRDHEWTALVASSFLRIAFLRERPSPGIPR